MNWSTKSKKPEDYNSWSPSQKQAWWESEAVRLDKLSDIYFKFGIYILSTTILLGTVVLCLKLWHLH